MTCTTSEDSDQPGHSPSVIRGFAVSPKLINIAKTQIRPRLILIFAGRVSPFVGFVVLPFKNLYQDLKKVASNLPHTMFTKCFLFFHVVIHKKKKKKKKKKKCFSAHAGQFYYTFTYPGSVQCILKSFEGKTKTKLKTSSSRVHATYTQTWLLIADS